MRIRRFLFALLTSGTLLLAPIVSGASLANQPHVPTDEWPYGVCDYFVEAGIAPGYAVDFFDGVEPREWGEFTDFIVKLIPLLREAEEREDFSLAGLDVDEMVLRLVSYFSQSLRIVTVEANDSNPLFESWFDRLLIYTDEEFTSGELLLLVTAKARSDEVRHPHAYDKVPLDSSAYDTFSDLLAQGILEGYPEDYFNKGATRTRYDFGVAIARLQDSLSSSYAIPDGINREDYVELLVEFSDQLAELG